MPFASAQEITRITGGSEPITRTTVNPYPEPSTTSTKPYSSTTSTKPYSSTTVKPSSSSTKPYSSTSVKPSTTSKPYSSSSSTTVKSSTSTKPYSSSTTTKPTTSSNPYSSTSVKPSTTSKPYSSSSSTSSKPTSPVYSSSSTSTSSVYTTSSCVADPWAQCGGTTFKGCAVCPDGYACVSVYPEVRLSLRSNRHGPKLMTPCSTRNASMLKERALRRLVQPSFCHTLLLKYIPLSFFSVVSANS